MCVGSSALFYLRFLDFRIICVPINPKDLVVKVSVVSRYFHFTSRLDTKKQAVGALKKTAVPRYTPQWFLELSRTEYPR